MVLCGGGNYYFCRRCHRGLSCGTLLLQQHAAASVPVCAAIARFEWPVSFPSSTAHDFAKFVMAFSGMLQEHSACLLLLALCFNSLFMSQKFFTLKPHLTKMLLSVTVLGTLEKGNAAGSECCFQMFTRDVVKSLLAGVTALTVLSDCCHTA